MSAITARRWAAGLIEHLGDVVEAVGALVLHVGGGLQEVADHLDPHPAATVEVDAHTDDQGRLVLTRGDYTDRVPAGDEGHLPSDDCPCGPRFLCVDSPTGGDAWERLHQPMTDRASTEDA